MLYYNTIFGSSFYKKYLVLVKLEDKWVCAILFYIYECAFQKLL